MISVLNYMKILIGKYNKKIVSPIVLSFLDSLFNSCMFGIMLWMLIDLSNNSFDFAVLKSGTIALVAVFIIRCVLQAVSFTQAQCLGPDVSKDLRLRVANHIRNLNLGFFNKNSIGHLNSVLMSDISEYEVIITHTLCDFIKVISFTAVSLIMAIVINWRYGLVLLAMTLVGIPLLIVSGRVSGKNAEKLRDAKQNVISRIVEYVNGIKTFRLYNLTGNRFKRLDDSMIKLKKESVDAEVSILPLVLSFSVITSFIVPVSLIFGAYLYFAHEVNSVEFLIIILLSVSLANILGVLSSLYPQIKSIAKASENICNVLDEKTFLFDRNNHGINQYDICFDHVGFHYTDEVEVLKNVTFRAKQGTTTALIGPSGSGKTTIVSLLARFWDVTSGSIAIGGTDIKYISPDILTQNMSIVFQEVYLLNDTVMNNIKVGNPRASEEEVYEAAKAARCHQFIMEMQDGYNTMIGEGGSTLSGGEKQRISIARALLKDAPIVLLDETTSSLDADNEKDIQMAFNRLMNGKTVFVIAHRLNTIRNADNILVLNSGCIEEQGNHETLIKGQGWYYGICQEQEKARNWKVRIQ